MNHDHGTHGHGSASADPDRRWLISALLVLLAFMVCEVTAGLLAHSLALITDAGHMLTDAAALLVALIAARIARRPAQGSFTYGFARIDALAGQANGITLLLLAGWFSFESIRRLINPPDATGRVMIAVAVLGVVVNIIATMLAKRADTARLSVRGAVSHLVNDVWAFLATAVAGVVIVLSGWTRADALASLIVAVLMAVTGIGLLRASGRIFLEAAPQSLDPFQLGAELAAVDGVAQVHDLHVWEIGPGEAALSAHVFVRAPRDCHAVAATLRQVLAERHGLRHATLQVDHAGESPTEQSLLDHCDDAHGPVHTATWSAPADQ
jgi:cobalt-zinc-cadmium efflux system protein